MLVTRANRGKKENDDVAIFKFLIQHFRSIMNSPKSTNKDISLAIRGYGMLAEPCKVFLSESDVRFMYNEMIMCTEQIYFGSERDVIDDKLMNLPSFLEAFSYIVALLDQVPDTFLVSLERLVVLLIECHPQLHQKMHFPCYAAILRVFFAVSHQGAAFREFLSRTIYQGVIRTCSRLPLTESDGDVNVKGQSELYLEHQITYQSYLGFWRVALQPTTVKELSMQCSIAEREHMANCIYDEVIGAVLKILSRLDLSTTKAVENSLNAVSSDTESTARKDHNIELLDLASDPTSDAQAVKPKDIIVFVNLVEFCRDLLVESGKTEFFRPWIHRFGQEVIIMAYRQPLVSGLYKLFTVCLRLCSRLSYFKGVTSIESFSSSSANFAEGELEDSKMDCTEDDLSYLVHKEASFNLFAKFAKEVSVQMKLYRDELLASCLILILSLPDEIVIGHLMVVIPAMQKALIMGRSYLPLARTALDTLEHWSCSEVAAAVRPHYVELLPLFDAYIKSSANIGVSASELVGSRGKASSVIATKQTRQAKLLKSKARSIVNSGKENAGQLEQVISRCISILGKLGGSINHVLVSRSELSHFSKLAIAWDTQKHLRFDVPFQDLKPTIYFDAFLPRVVELATTSGSRRPKIAACELLHALVLYMVGRESQVLGHRDVVKDAMNPLYQKIFPAVMLLACEVELLEGTETQSMPRNALLPEFFGGKYPSAEWRSREVAQQLFKPLLFQLIHWFTSSQMQSYQHPVTIVLLDSIMDGLINPTDAALRDLSGSSLQEFVLWSIKQSTKEQLEKSQFSIKSVLRRLYSYARHPSAFKRLGASLGFNSIYTIFREEASLVDTYILEILVTFVESLALAHSDDKVLGTQHQCKAVLIHLERILRVKADMLNKPSDKRRVPKEWQRKNCLKDAIDWLLLQCGRPQTECRHVCMQMVFSLSPLLPGNKPVQNYFEDLLTTHGEKHFLQRFECSAYKSDESTNIFSSRPPLPTTANESFSLQATEKWFEQVLAAIDCYTWVFGQNLIAAAKLLSVGSVLFWSLRYFVENFALFNLDSLGSVRLFTPREREQFCLLKCTIIVRLFTFLTILLNRHSEVIDKLIPDEFWKEPFWNTLLSCVFDPGCIGFNMADFEIITKLPEEIRAVLANLRKYPKADKQFQRALTFKLSETDFPLPLSLNQTTANYSQLSCMIAAHKLLYEAGYKEFLSSKCFTKDSMGSKLLLYVFQSLTLDRNGERVSCALSVEGVDIGRQLLQLSFTFGVELGELIKLLLDQSPVILSGGSARKTSIGEVLYATFKSAITNHLVLICEDFVKRVTSDVDIIMTRSNVVGSLLVGTLDTVGRDSQLRQRYGKVVVESVIVRWQSFSCWWEGSSATLDSKMMSLSVLTKVLIIDASFIASEGHPAYERVWSMYCRMLMDRTTSLPFKSRALDLLMFFVSTPHKDLRSTLDYFIATNFPMSSSEYLPGSPKCNEYIGALDKLLSTLELSLSPLLLELLIGILCREKQHIHELKIQEAMTVFMKRLPFDKQMPSLNVAFNVYNKNDGGLLPEQRRMVLERVCLHLLNAAHSSALVEFFEEHIVRIMASIEDLKTRKVSEVELVEAICGLSLVELMYRRLPKDCVHSKQSRINQKYWSGKKSTSEMTGKEMTTALTKAASILRCEDVLRLANMSESVNHLKELARMLHCAAYNVLIAVISSTQSEIKFYNGFIFPADNLAKGIVLWEHLIDLEKSYKFPVEVEAALIRRKEFMAIRSGIQEDSDSSDDSHRAGGVHYMASQYLADSSLNTEISQFDFATSAVSMSSSTLSSQGTSHVKLPSAAKERSGSNVAVSEVENSVIELEVDELNRHECMSSVVALLQHMNRINPVEKETERNSMPQWMDSMNKKMSSSTCPLNIKIFIARLASNAPEVFQPYAKWWLTPLLELVLCKDFMEKYGNGINYFVNDIMVTALSWHSYAVPEVSLVRRIVEFIATHCHHDNNQVLRHNLEMLKTVVEVWKQHVEVPTRILFENFSFQDMKLKRNVTGIQMVGVMVANKLVPYRPTDGIDKSRFYKELAKNMNNDSKSVYAAASEVLGMSLALLSEKEKSEDECEWRENLVNEIVKFLVDKKSDKLITCVHCIQLNYPEISDRFKAKIFFWLPKLHGIFKTQCLEIIRRRVEHFEDAFKELKSKGFEDILSHRDEGTQLMAIGIVHSLLNNLPCKDLETLMPHLKAIAISPSSPCRMAVYDIFMWIYDNYDNDSDENPVEGEGLWSGARNVLLLGLSDEDEANRLRIRNFWSHETRLPNRTFDRLLTILDKMYSTETEQQFLSYATNFMLEMTSRSPDYNRAMFEQPLSECKFEDYPVQSAWKQRHLVMTPLFVETQATLSAQLRQTSTLGTASIAPGTTMQVRQTMDVANFTATQAPGGDPFYNWLTQSRFDTFADDAGSLRSTDSFGAQSSLMFKIGRGPHGQQRTNQRPAVGPEFGKSRLGTISKVGASDEVDGLDSGNSASDILRLKKRFVVRRDEENRVFFARRQTRLNQQRDIVEQERKQRRENEVTMYRRYRIGDLPDIQIPYSALVAPLQGLAHSDVMIARQLFCALLKSIVDQVEEELPKKDVVNFMSKLNGCLNHMLSSTTQFFTPFIACILDVCLSNVTKLHIDASTINTVCVASQLQPIGVLLLEELIMQTEDDTKQKFTKRARLDTSVAPVDTAKWIELARLYKSLGEYDIVRGILSSRVSTHKITSEAVDAEMRSDYNLAVKLYNEGLSELTSIDNKSASNEAISEEEIELWEESRLLCYNQLCRWDKIESICEKMLDVSPCSQSDETPILDRVWNDSRFQESLLPYLMRGKVKRVLEGAEDQQSLLNFVDRAMTSPDRRSILESFYSDHLAMLYIWQDDYSRAKHYAGLARSAFLQDWCGLDDLMSSCRTSRLQAVQQLVELDEFLKFITDSSSGVTQSSAVSLAEQWASRQPDNLLDQSPVWDDVITNRCVYLDHIADRSNNKPEIFNRFKTTMRLQQVEAATIQGNFSVALQLLKCTQKEAVLCGGNVTKQWNWAFTKTHQARCRWSTTLTTKDKLKALHDSKRLLREYKDDVSRQLAVNTCSVAAEMALRDAATIKASDDTKAMLTEIAGCSPTTSYDEIVKNLIESGYQSLECAFSAGASCSDGAKVLSDTYLALYKYCDKYLRIAEDSENGELVKCSSFSSFPRTAVKSLLAAVKLNSLEARQLFPRLLQLVACYADTTDEFVRSVAEVPCWMLLGWVSQMTAILDKPESSAIQEVLLNMAQQYPMAVVFAYRLSAETYRFDTSTQCGRQGKSLSEKLEKLLSKNRLLTKFVRELEQFDQPNAIFKEWSSDIESALRSTQTTEHRLRQLYANLNSKLIGGRRRNSDAELFENASPEDTEDMVVPGPYFARFQSKFTSELEKLCGRNGSQLLQLAKAGANSKVVKDFRSNAKKLIETMNVFCSKTPPPNTLKDYSGWMSTFQASDYDEQLELPGQYTGLSKPMPDYHIKISSFTDTVLVMTSIRRPKRITIRGNDEKEYKYLVKCGEDLRQDQRIEQLLDLMNDIYARHVSCRQRHLHIRTYQVVPMTSRVGVIEWMDHTTPLLDEISKAQTEAESNWLKGDHNPCADHKKFMGEYAKSYHDANKKLSRSEVVTAFRKRENLLPGDLLQRVYRKMSASSEAYYRLRCEFATSHAQLCISHYILGIGDRHLANFMLDLQTGAIVGIDFGHAFGSATQFLPIPELMPFRLTRQLRNVMLPLRERGLMEGVMVHSLQALRSNSELLLTMMDVFIKEPSLDWQQFAEKQKMAMKDSPSQESDVDEAWYPREKVRFAGRKLHGDNCVHIMRDELQLGHGQQPYFSCYEKILMGDRDDNIRARLPASNLTADQQVACLIDLATDPNVLGRSWVGWSPWM